MLTRRAFFQSLMATTALVALPLPQTTNEWRRIYNIEPTNTPFESYWIDWKAPDVHVVGEWTLAEFERFWAKPHGPGELISIKRLT